MLKGRPNCRFPTDNDQEIPVLPRRAEAKFIDQPVWPWGGRKRGTETDEPALKWKPSRGGKGTLVFYRDDDFFKGLWDTPDTALGVGATVFAEPNFSLCESSARAYVDWVTLKKRWLARYWHQVGGREILVDLNVPSKWLDRNGLGVPAGWRAYATRGSDHAIDALRIQHQWAVDRFTQKGGEHEDDYQPGDLVFLVYGGGPKVQKFCREHQLEHYYNENIIWRDGRNSEDR